MPTAKIRELYKCDINATLSIKSSLGGNVPEAATQNPWCSYTVPAQTLMKVEGY